MRVHKVYGANFLVDSVPEGEVVLGSLLSEVVPDMLSLFKVRGVAFRID